MANNLDFKKKLSINWIMFIYFFSGACSLIDEVIWVRLLKLTLGNTVYATSIVVSVFLGGLALGALIMSRYSDRVVKRLQLYALLEGLITISALCIPWALKLTDNIYVWFYQAYHPTNTQLLVVQVIISASILLVPTMLMGSTLPLLGRFITALEKEAGHLVGKLYALNTLGAAVGCFSAGFVLIRSFGVMGTLYTAAILNLLVAFGGWVLSRFSKNTVGEPSETVSTDKSKVIISKTVDIKFYILVLAFFASGLISISYELLWIRSIVHLFGGYTYVFSAVLTVYLLGNVIGAGIGSRLAKRLKEPVGGFAVTLSALGVCGIFYLPFLILWTTEVKPYFVNTINSWFPKYFHVINPLVQSLFLFLVPAVIMGIGFPIALQAWANHIHKVGRSTGTAYSANTLGAVVGGIITGFVLIPFLGVQLSISLLGLSGIWIGCIMYFIFSKNLREKLYFGLRLNLIKRWVLAALAIFLVIFVAKTPLTLFDTVVDIGNPSFISSTYSLVAIKEGLTTTVSLHKDPKDDSLHMYSSGQSIAGDNYVERGDQKMLGHFGILLNRKAKNVLSVGFGSGETTACLAMHNLKRIDCVEIAPEVVDVSLKFFKHINLGDKLNDKINMIYMDAKNYIHLTDNKYDVIINDSIHPLLFAENASLYTKEYFESARKHLNNNGIIISWLPTYSMSAAVFESIIGTLMDVFPHVTLWFLTPHPAPLVLIIGSEYPQYFSPEHIDSELRKKNVAANLSEINIRDSIDVLSCYIADENDLRKVIGNYSVNSDYFPFVEFATDISTTRQEIVRRFVPGVRSDSVHNHIDWTGFNEERKEQWFADYKKLYNTSTYILMTNSADNFWDQLKYCMEGLSIMPNNSALLELKRRMDESMLESSLQMIQSGEVYNALNLAEQTLKKYPKSAIAWIIKSTAVGVMGDMQKSLTYAQKAVELDPDNISAHINLGSILYTLGQFEKAIIEFETTLQLAKKNPLNSDQEILLLSSLADAYFANNQVPEAISTAEAALELASSKGYKESAQAIQQQLSLFKFKTTD